MMWGTQPCISRALRAAGEASYTPNAVDFDGTNDYLSTAGALSGVSDGRKGIFAASINTDADGTLDRLFYMENGASDFAIRKQADNSLIIFMPAAGGSSGNVVQVDTAANSFTAAGGWHSLLIAWDLTTLSAEVFQIYLNDVDVKDTVTTLTGGGDIDYTGAVYIGATSAGGSKWNGQMSEIYINFAETMDISVEANRRKFFDATGYPVDKGADGSLPTGTAPAVYLHNPAATFGVNSGSSDDFTITGSLTDVTPPP